MFKLLKNKYGNQKGFTILENIMATVILGVGLLGGMMTMQNATLNTVRHDMATLATLLANEKIESILADNSLMGYDQVDSGSYPAENLQQAYGMSRQVEVIEVSQDDLETEEEGSGLKKIAVTVSWGNSASQRVVVTTLVAQATNN